MRAWKITVLFVCCSCAPRVATVPVQTGPVVVPTEQAETQAEARERNETLGALCARARTGDSLALQALQLTLTPARGARELDGTPATDERLEVLRPVLRVREQALVVVKTTCGNAAVFTVRFRAGQWSYAAREALVQGQEPGGCARTELHVDPVALRSDRREQAVLVWSSEDATGGSVRAPTLSVVELERTGGMHWLLRNVSYGGMDDRTGARTNARWTLLEDVPAPRDLFVELSPGAPGPGGPAPAVIVRRRYGWRGDGLYLAQEQREAAE